MRLYANQGYRGKIIDLEENRVVTGVVWVDCEEGLIEVVRYRNGKPMKNIDGSDQTFIARGRFRFIPDKVVTKPKQARKVEIGADKCVKCSDPLTLPGDDLCFFCRSNDRGKKIVRAEKLTSPLLNVKCYHKGCDRLAEWSVSDETEATPQKRGGRLWERGIMVSRRNYCSRHYSPPRILDADGEVMAIDEEAMGVRPS